MATNTKRFADSQEVREWALTLTNKEKKDLGIAGLEVSERGRFHSSIVRAFNMAHEGLGIRYVPIGRKNPRLPEVLEEHDVPDDTPVTRRQPRQEAPDEEDTPVVPPTPLPLTKTDQQTAMVMAMPNAPGPIMDLLQNGQSVVVVYVPLPMQAAAV